jgi:hypothetical protein
MTARREFRLYKLMVHDVEDITDEKIEVIENKIRTLPRDATAIGTLQRCVNQLRRMQKES